jgi:hypothetical protein
VDPDDLLGPDTRDARRLLALWLIRRSAVPIFWLGLIVGVLVAPGGDVEVTFTSPEDAFNHLWSPAAGIALALIIRVGTSMAGFALAAPQALKFGAGASARYSGSHLGRLLDRFGAARGYRSLRFTRSVRDAAAARLGEDGARHDRLDRWLTVANVVLPVVTLVVAIVLG